MSFPRVMIDESITGLNGVDQSDPEVANGLRRMRSWSSSSRQMVRHLLKLSQRANRPLRVLNVGSGCGDLPIYWMCRARRYNIPLQVTVLERSDRELDFCFQAARDAGLEIGSLKRDFLVDRFPTGFDVVTCSFLLHQLDEQQIVRLLHEMWRSCSQSVIVCDWERSKWNVGLASATSSVISRNPQVRAAAVRRIRAALTRDEFAALTQRALGLSFPVHRSLPCQYVAIMDQSCETQWVPELQPSISGAIAG